MGRNHVDDARRWMVTSVKGPRYSHRAFTPQRTHHMITMLGAQMPIRDRVVHVTMIWLGRNPDGTGEARTPLEDERWLFNANQIAECLTPHRFVDPSFTAHAAKVLGPAPP